MGSGGLMSAAFVVVAGNEMMFRYITLEKIMKDGALKLTVSPLSRCPLQSHSPFSGLQVLSLPASRILQGKAEQSIDFPAFDMLK